MFCAAALAADLVKPQKAYEVSGIPFFTVAKRGYVPQMVPGLTGALLFSGAQKAEIVTVYEEIFNRADVQAAKRLKKGDPNVTEIDREAARRTLEKAAAQFHERLQGLLPGDRKELIEKMNRAYEEAGLSVKPAEKGSKDPGPKQTAVNDAFVKALEKILTPEQQQGMAAAAEEEARRAANVKKVGKVK